MDIKTKLKALIEANTTSCTFRTTTTQVLSPETIAQIATLEHIQAYLHYENDAHNATEIGPLDPCHVSDMAETIRAHASKLFVLTVAYDYGTAFLDEMITKQGYMEERWDVELMRANRKVAKCHEHIRAKVLKDQALVCAPSIKFGTFHARVITGALPFQKTVEKEAMGELFDNAIAVWEVVLGEDFQQGEFGTTELFVSEHLYGKWGEYVDLKKGEEHVYGKPMAGLLYEDRFYLLWNRHVVSDDAPEVIRMGGESAEKGTV